MKRFLKNPVNLLIVMLIMIQISCTSDGGDTFYGCVKGECKIFSNLLRNSDMNFVHSPTPSGQSAILSDVQFNGNAVPGGSTSMTFTSSEPLSEAYLQVGNEDGYYVRQLAPLDLISSEDGVYVYSIPLQFSQDLSEGELQVAVIGVTPSRSVSEPAFGVVQVIKAGNGALQVTLSWDTNDDLDLHIITPSGTELFYTNPSIAASSSIGKAKLDIDSNAGCEIDGKNIENAYFESPLENGDYYVIVCLYKKCADDDAEGARYNVTANIRGEFVSFSPNQNGQFASDDEDKTCTKIGTISIRK